MLSWQPKLVVQAESKRTVLTLLVLIQTPQIGVAGNQPSPQMFTSSDQQPC